MLFLTGVNYEQDRYVSGPADRMPALFFANHAIPVPYNIPSLLDLIDLCNRLLHPLLGTSSTKFNVCSG
jgi:hypothetical protein